LYAAVAAAAASFAAAALGNLLIKIINYYQLIRPQLENPTRYDCGDDCYQSVCKV